LPLGRQFQRLIAAGERLSLRTANPDLSHVKGTQAASVPGSKSL